MSNDYDPIKPTVLQRFPSQSVPDYIAVLQFNSDDDQEMFRYWWEMEGYLLFRKYVEDMDYEPFRENLQPN